MGRREEKTQRLQSLWNQARQALDPHTGSAFVPGVGDLLTPLMVIGEAPGQEEDRQQIPFCGPSGKLLDRMLDSIGWNRDEVWITNLVKFRPPGNRDPRPEELPPWQTLMKWEVDIIDPKLIVTLGRFASSLFWPDPHMASIAGVVHERRGRTVLPMYHPAYLLRKGRAAQGEAIIAFQKAIGGEGLLS